jgi:predicted MFS family arabinose efflux permease
VTGLLLALAAVGFSIGSLLSHRVARWSSGKRAILVGGLLSAVAITIALVSGATLWVVVALIFAYGFCQGIRGAASSNLGLTQAPGNRGAMMGFRASVVQLGYVIGGALGGIMLLVGGYVMLGIVFGSMVALASVLMPLLVDDREREPGGPTAA